MMKLAVLSVLALSISIANGRFVERHETNQVTLNNDDHQLYLIELEPGVTKLVTEEQKWELKRVWSVANIRLTVSDLRFRMAKTSWTLPITKSLAPYEY